MPNVSPKREKAIREIIAAIKENGGRRPASWSVCKTRRGVPDATWQSWIIAAEQRILTKRDIVQAMKAVTLPARRAHIIRSAAPVQFDFFAYIDGLKSDVDLIREKAKHKNGQIIVGQLARGVELGIKLVNAITSGYAEAWRAHRMKRFQDSILGRLKERDPSLAAQILADLEAMDAEAGVMFQEADTMDTMEEGNEN